MRRLNGILRDRCCFVLKSLIAGTARETVSGRASIVAHTRSIQSINGPRSRTIARTAVISIKQKRAVIGIAALDSNRLLGLRFPGLSCACNEKLHLEAAAVAQDPVQPPHIQFLASFTAASAVLLLCQRFL